VAREHRKPFLFVGSSVESLKYAYAVQENLDHDALVKVWPQGVFNIASYGLESLLSAAGAHDFGVFIFAPDDLVVIRGKKHQAVRDNVLFELGLFMGRLGRERTFVLAPERGNLHLPSDLLGWNVARFDSRRKDIAAALGVACNKVRIEIQRLGRYRPGMTARLSATAKIIKGSARRVPPLRNFGRRIVSVVQPI
jgi:predicted nucleotide-binding protein